MKKILPILALISLIISIGGLAPAQAVTPPLIDPIVGIHRIGEIAFAILMALAVVMLIVAGIMFLFAGGDATRVGQARDMVLYALIGIVIALLARGVVAFLERYFR